MHLKDIKDLSSDDVLATLGLQARRTVGDYLFPALGIFGVGVLVGAGMGLLFAPKPGSDLRQQLGSRIRRRKANGPDTDADIEDAGEVMAGDGPGE